MTGAGPAGPVVGTPAQRLGGRARLDGSQRFVADIRLEDVLEVKLVTIDAAHARIRHIDASAALALPGVVTVLTAQELPKPVPRFGPAFRDRPVLATDEVKYHGEPVAAVAATSRSVAEQAAMLVKVDYDELPGVFTLTDALAEGAPLVQDPALRPGDPLAGSNVLRERRYGWGDPDAYTADLVLERRYTFPMVTHFAIEPHGCLVDAGPDGVSLWSPVQHPYLLQRIMAEILDLPLTKVRVLAPDPGGAFGGKQTPRYEPLVTFLSLRTGRPCRLVLTLEETFQTVRRAATEIHVRSGFAGDGRILFHDVRGDFLLGAYADVGERVTAKSSYLACGPYRVESARIVARAVLSHTTPSCAFRGFGTPQVAWAMESQLDEAARRLGIDRLEIRLRNLARRGEEIVEGEVPADGDWEQSVRLAADAVGWGTPLPPGRGRGIAAAIKSGATTGLSYSTVRLLFDGSVTVYAGTSDMGQGARTIFAQIAADELGAPLEDVQVVMGDTAVVPFDLQTSASRSTVFMGNAIHRACQDIHRQLRELAAEVKGVDASGVTVEAGRVLLPGGGELSIRELVASGLGRLRGELIGNGTMRKTDMPEHPLGGTPAFYEFNCTAFEVEVDRETGETLIVKHVTVGDVGKALNPLQVEMQDEGAAIMGLGHTMMEQVILDEAGRIRNLGALDYRIPTTKDVPVGLTALAVENEDGPGPYGAKGISEGALLCTAPAFASAVAEAAGVVIPDLPLTPERLWLALQQQTPDLPGRGPAIAE